MTDKCVYTCIYGGYDRLRGLPQAPPGWDHVLVTDRSDQHPEGWRVLHLPFRDMTRRRASRQAKIAVHRHLDHYRYTVYCDASFRWAVHPATLCERLGWPDWAATRHWGRDCAYAELRALAKFGLAREVDTDAMIAGYRAEGLPEHAGLLAAGLLLRSNLSAQATRLNEAWRTAYAASPIDRDQPALAKELALADDYAWIHVMDRAVWDGMASLERHGA